MDAFHTTNFDRFARYHHVRQARAELFAARHDLRVLDVGDPYGSLGQLFPDDHTVSVDLFADGAGQITGHDHVTASGLHLPFPTGSFDLVASHDTLEHLPEGERLPFVEELLRVARGPVVLVAPFRDPRTEECEAIVNAYYVAHVGRPLTPLEEHATYVLPDLRAITQFLVSSGVDHVVTGDGWLHHWLTFMLLKAHYVSIGAAKLDAATDLAFNQLLRDRDGRVPHYRRAIVLRPGEAASARCAAAPADGPPAAEDVMHEIRELTTIARGVMTALPRGEDPTAATSALRAWISTADGEASAVGEVASSLRVVLDAVAEAAAADVVEVDEESRPTPSLSIVVARPALGAHDPAALAALLATLATTAATSAAEVVIDESLREDADVPVTVAGQLRWVRNRGRRDDIGWALTSTGGDVVLLVDERLAVPNDFVERLLGALEVDPSIACAGFAEPPLDAPGTGIDHGDALALSGSCFALRRAACAEIGPQIEDARDLAWRLVLAGFRVQVVGTAETRSAVVGQTRAELVDDQARLLRSRFRNLGPERLPAAFATDLLALIAFAGPRHAALALTRFVDDLPVLLASRRHVQKQRKAADEEVFHLVGEPVVGAGDADASHVRHIVGGALASIPVRRSRGPVMVAIGDGTEPRLVAIARAMAAVREVNLVIPDGVDEPDAGPWAVIRSHGTEDLLRILDGGAVVVAGAATVARVPQLLAISALLAVDLAGEEATGRRPIEPLLLQRGDLFLTATESQREHWLGRLVASGRAMPRHGDDDGSLRRLIDVVAAPPEPPAESDVMVIKGRDAAVALDADLVVLDLDEGDDVGLATAVIERFAEVREHFPNARLYVLPAAGATLPGAPRRTAEAVGHSFAQEPVDESARAAILREADVVVRTVRDDVRGRLGSPERGLHLLAAGVPQVVTPHDPAARWVVTTGVGGVATDVDSVIDSIASTLSTKPASRRQRTTAVALRLAGRSGYAPVLRLANEPWRWSAGDAPAVAADDDLIARQAAALDGLRRELRQARRSPGPAEPGPTDLEVQRLRREVARLAAAETEARQRADRVAGHPLVRVAVRGRRLLRGR